MTEWNNPRDRMKCGKVPVSLHAASTRTDQSFALTVADNAELRQDKSVLRVCCEKATCSILPVNSLPARRCAGTPTPSTV